MNVLLRLQLAILAHLAVLRTRLARFLPARAAVREGQAFLEYALVLAVIAVIVLIAAQSFGNDLAAIFNRIRNRLGSLG